MSSLRLIPIGSIQYTYLCLRNCSKRMPDHRFCRRWKITACRDMVFGLIKSAPSSYLVGNGSKIIFKSGVIYGNWPNWLHPRADGGFLVSFREQHFEPLSEEFNYDCMRHSSVRHPSPTLGVC